MKGKPMSKFSQTMLSRREILGAPLALTLAGFAEPANAAKRPRVAAVITEYRRNSHADVIIGRMLEGYFYEKRRTPRLEIVSMYTDQVPKNDMSRDMAAKHNIPIYPTIQKALVMDGDNLAVDGVVFIGEHGNYHWNIKDQKLYPRWYLYKQIVDVFKKTGKAVPVFSDKHLSVDWDEAKWMYDQSREMNFPLMAGSSLPLAWRYPKIELEIGTPVEKAVVSFYGGKEAYGFHALESLQCMVERRRGGETGVAAVECLEGADVWKWTDANQWAKRLLDEALKRCPDRKKGSPRDNAKEPIVFIVNYNDGLQAAVYLLNGHVRQTGFAAKIKGKDTTVSTLIKLQSGRPYGHFSPLVYHAEELIINGKASYPVERTLLTTGTVAALMNSAFYNRRLETPHLNVTYRAQKESLFNRGPEPEADENFGIGP
jgi:hypothetical protein